MALNNNNPEHILTVEEQRAGGKASVEARREKKKLREIMNELLEKEITDKSGKTMTGAEAICVKMFQQALNGDKKAFEICRDTSGQTVQQIEIKQISDVDISEVERLIEDDEKASNSSVIE